MKLRNFWILSIILLIFDIVFVVGLILYTNNNYKIYDNAINRIDVIGKNIEKEMIMLYPTYSEYVIKTMIENKMKESQEIQELKQQTEKFNPMGWFCLLCICLSLSMLIIRLILYFFEKYW
jgi:uncharacterized membrane protein (DUF485 family)